MPDPDKSVAPEAPPEIVQPAVVKPDPEAAVEEKTVAPESTGEETPESAEPGTEEKEISPLPAIVRDSHGRVSRTHRQHGSNNERVSFFQNSTLAAGEKVETVVSIFGSSTSAGEVGDAVVSVIGSSTSSGNVGGPVVSVIGNTRVTGGSVGDASVAVLGSNYINGHVRGEVVAILGNVELGPDAVVDGGVVCVGGTLTRDPKAVVKGDVQNIALGGHHFNFDGLHAWFAQCLLYARPLAFGPNLMWAWWIALASLGFYALVALVVPAGVNKCVQTLEDRPGKSILAALLTLLLTPVAYLLLVLTLAIAIGVVLIPLFSMGLFFASLFGKVVMLAWLGRRITKLFGNGPLAHPVFAVLIGGVIVLGLYTVPVLGFIVYKLLGILGLGVVVYTLLLSYQSSRPVPVKPAVAPLAPTAGAVMAEPPVLGETAPTPVVASLPPVVSASTLEHAGFWIRIAASFLDVILVAMVSSLVHSVFRGVSTGGLPFWLFIYSVGMWATKGTTIGGIVCGLKVVRLDDRPLDWGVAIVRGLSAFLSLAVAGLGFIWVAFDNEKQSWHDKIAGTTIVRVPKGTPLF